MTEKCTYCGSLIAGEPCVETVDGNEYLLHSETCAEEARSDPTFSRRILFLEASRNVRRLMALGSFTTG